MKNLNSTSLFFDKFDTLCRSSMFTRFVLVAGLAICLLAGITGDSLCPDAEFCFVYASETAYGGLLYYLGAVIFALLIVSENRQTPHKFALFSLLALALDIPFLIIQTAFLPCTICLLVTNCLLINAMIAIEPWLKNRHGSMASRGAVVLLLVSGMLFGHNWLSLSKTTMQGHSLMPASSTDARLFFAPADKEHLAQIVEMYHAVQGKVQLLPVSDRAEDLHAALRLRDKLMQSLPFEVALRESQQETAQAVKARSLDSFLDSMRISFLQVLKMRLGLLQNATLLKNAGGQGVPSLQVGNGPICSGKSAQPLNIIPFRNK